MQDINTIQSTMVFQQSLFPTENLGTGISNQIKTDENYPFIPNQDNRHRLYKRIKTYFQRMTKDKINK